MAAPAASPPPRPLRALLGEEGARRFLRDRPAMLGVWLAAALALLTVVLPIALRLDPNESDFSLTRDALGPPGPSAAHWLGADPLFRDVLARLAAGGQVSLAIALSATALATALGALVGVASGMAAGTRWSALDSALMRLVDVVLALPYLLFVTAIGVAVGRADVGTILLVLGLTGWTGAARLVRAKTLELAQRDFVVAARALGAGPLHVVRRHVLPNVAGTLVVLATMSVGQMILAEAALGYLTVGVQPPQATWGRMLFEAEPYLGTRLSLVAAPGLAILLSVLAWNRVGEGLRDALDPTAAEPLPRRRAPVNLLLAGAAILLAVAASPDALRPPLGRAPAEVRPVRGGTLRVATTVNVRALDPALAYDEIAAAIQEHVFARLFTWDDAGRLVPELAREVTVTDGGKRYLITLREGVRFHDGAELRSVDIQRSIERTLHPDTPSPAASLYDMIVGFDDFHGRKAPHLAGVQILGPYALAIDLRAPDATFLPRLTLSFAAPVCPSSGEIADPASHALPCGAGPFRVAQWEGDGPIVLVRHEGYYRPDRPYLDAIEWSTGVRSTTQRYKFEDGALDYVRDLTPGVAARYRADPAWSGLGRWVPASATNAIFLNTELPPFDRRAMRRAVAFAVDPSALERLRPDVMALDRVLPNTIPGPPRDVPMRLHDPEQALAAMAEAGFPFDPRTGRGGYPEVIDYLAVPDSFDQAAGEVFQQQLAKVGLRIRLRLVSFATYLAEVSRRRTTRMGRQGWRADFPDASNFFEPTLSSAAIQDEGSQNYAFFQSAELDRVLAEARAEQDQDRRFARYARAEEIVRDEVPWVPTYVSRVFEVWQPYVRGYAASPLVSPRFNDAWLDPSARGAPAPLAAALLPARGRRSP